MIAYLKQLFKKKKELPTVPAKRIRITAETIIYFPKINKLYQEDKVRFDSTGRLRYRYGAPVGDMILVRVNKDGTPVYKESAQEWFDPEGQKAKDFVWP